MAERRQTNCTGSPRFWTRRDFLWQMGGGLGAVALADLLRADDKLEATAKGEGAAGPHFSPKAKRVIQLFMSCGVSQVDSFDYKPALEKLDGQSVSGLVGLENLFFGQPGKLMRSPFKFARYGQSGKWVSDIFQHTGRHVDRLALVHSMVALSNSHGPATFQMNTGFIRPGYPSVGSWVVYGLGQESRNLPALVVLVDRGLPPGNSVNWSAGFLPAKYQGTMFRPTGDPILDLRPPASITPEGQKDAYELLAKMNEEHLAKNPGDGELAARIAAYELAARMQTSAPEVAELAGESEATRELYGVNSSNAEQAAFARNCLLARRLIERGVRFVTVYCGGPNMPTGKFNWDAHDDLEENHRRNAGIADRPIGALLTDLAQRGLLDETVVTWTGEFGRTPFRQGNAKGRDHNPGGFTLWMCGAGVKGGVSYGQTDEIGYQAVAERVTIYDFHATLLHLLGLDHERLTYYHNGRRQRLTDVHGRVVKELLA